MEIYVRKLATWVPEWENNKDNPPKEQIKWNHTFLTTEQRARFFYLQPMKERQLIKAQTLLESGDGEDRTEAEELLTDREIIQDLVGVAKLIDKGWENFTIVYEDGEKKEVKTIEDFYNSPDAFPILRAQLEAYVLSLTARQDSKNLPEPSPAT